MHGATPYVLNKLGGNTFASIIFISDNRIMNTINIESMAYGY